VTDFDVPKQRPAGTIEAGGAHGGPAGNPEDTHGVVVRSCGAWAGSRSVTPEEPRPTRAGQTVDQSALARTMVQLADTLVDDFDVVEVLTNLARECVELLHVSAAGLMLLGIEGDLRVLAASSEATEVLELLELQANRGPSLECFQTGLPVVGEDLTSAVGRWPVFAVEAVSAGYFSVHAFPMRHRTSVIGVLNLFCDQPGLLGAEEAATAQALVDMAALGVLHHQALTEARLLNDQLQRALDSRVVIEQAKGVIAARLGIPVDDAFLRLRAHARTNRRRLADAAEDIVAGRLPPASLR
jgi:GAF domain-containing protein